MILLFPFGSHERKKTLVRQRGLEGKLEEMKGQLWGTMARIINRFQSLKKNKKKRAVSVTPTPNTDIQRNKGYPSYMFYRCNQSGRYWNQGRSFINSYSNITEHGFHIAKSDGTQQGRHKINTNLAVPGRFPVVNSAFHNAFNQLAQLGLLNLHIYLTW